MLEIETSIKNIHKFKKQQGEPQKEELFKTLNENLESEYTFLEYYEDRSDRLIILYNELLDLKKIFDDMNYLINSQEKELQLIEDNIQLVKDEITTAELDIVIANNEGKSTNYKYIFLGILLLPLSKFIF